MEGFQQPQYPPQYRPDGFNSGASHTTTYQDYYYGNPASYPQTSGYNCSPGNGNQFGVNFVPSSLQRGGDANSQAGGYSAYGSDQSAWQTTPSAANQSQFDSAAANQAFLQNQSYNSQQLGATGYANTEASALANHVHQQGNAQYGASQPYLYPYPTQPGDGVSQLSTSQHLSSSQAPPNAASFAHAPQQGNPAIPPLPAAPPPSAPPPPTHPPPSNPPPPQSTWSNTSAVPAGPNPHPPWSTPHQDSNTPSAVPNGWSNYPAPATQSNYPAPAATQSNYPAPAATQSTYPAQAATQSNQPPSWQNSQHPPADSNSTSTYPPPQSTSFTSTLPPPTSYSSHPPQPAAQATAAPAPHSAGHSARLPSAQETPTTQQPTVYNTQPPPLAAASYTNPHSNTDTYPANPYHATYGHLAAAQHPSHIPPTPYPQSSTTYLHAPYSVAPHTGAPPVSYPHHVPPPMVYGAPTSQVGAARSRVALPDVARTVVDIEQLVRAPGRGKRPKKMLFILRGLPGSGKSMVAKKIKELEVENGGSAPRIHSIDDYFLTEVEKEVDDETGGRKGRKRKIVENQYCYDAKFEGTYQRQLVKAVTRTVDEGRYSIVVVDTCNVKIDDVKEYWNAAQRSGYEAYVLQPLCMDPEACHRRNIHERSLEEVKSLWQQWEPTPPLFVELSMASIYGPKKVQIEDVDMESSDGEEEAAGEGTAGSAATFQVSHSSRWEGDDDKEGQDVKSKGKSSRKKMKTVMSDAEFLSNLDGIFKTGDKTESGTKKSAGTASVSGATEAAVEATAAEDGANSEEGGNNVAAERKGSKKSVRWADEVDDEEEGFRIGPPRQLEQTFVLEGLGPPKCESDTEDEHGSFQDQVKREQASFRSFMFGRGAATVGSSGE